MVIHIDKKSGATFNSGNTTSQVTVGGKLVYYTMVSNIIFIGGCVYNGVAGGDSWWIGGATGDIPTTTAAICTALGKTFKSHMLSGPLHSSNSSGRQIAYYDGAVWADRTCSSNRYLIAIETL